MRGRVPRAIVGAVNPAPSQRTRMSAALTVVGAVLLMCGVIMALVGEAMRLKRGELHGLVSGGVVVAILGLVCGIGALVVAAGPSRQHGRFWTPGHPGYPVSPARFQASYPQPWSEPPEQPDNLGFGAEPAYASPAYRQSYAEPVHAGPGDPDHPVRGPFDPYDRFAAGQAAPSVLR